MDYESINFFRRNRYTVVKGGEQYAETKQSQNRPRVFRLNFAAEF